MSYFYSKQYNTIISTKSRIEKDFRIIKTGSQKPGWDLETMEKWLPTPCGWTHVFSSHRRKRQLLCVAFHRTWLLVFSAIIDDFCHFPDRISIACQVAPARPFAAPHLLQFPARTIPGSLGQTAVHQMDYSAHSTIAVSFLSAALRCLTRHIAIASTGAERIKRSYAVCLSPNLVADAIVFSSTDVVQ